MDPNPDFQRRRNPERNAAGGGTYSIFFSQLHFSHHHHIHANTGIREDVENQRYDILRADVPRLRCTGENRSRENVRPEERSSSSCGTI